MIRPCFPPFYDPIFIFPDNLGAEISDVLLQIEETIIPPWGRYVCHIAKSSKLNPSLAFQEEQMMSQAALNLPNYGLHEAHGSSRCSGTLQKGLSLGAVTRDTTEGIDDG